MIPRLIAKKIMQLSVTPGSPEYEKKMAALYQRLGELKTQGELGSSPLFGPRVMEVLGSSKGLPADSYKALFYEIPSERDRILIDMLLQRSYLVMPSLVFMDNVALDAGIQQGKVYTNDQLIELVYHPKSQTAPALVDPAVYVRRTPRETVADLITVPQTIRTALAAIFCASILGDDSVDIVWQAKKALESYSNRPPQEREKDAKTVLGLISTYTWHSNETLQVYGTEVARVFSLVFSHDNETHLIEKLWKVLEYAASIQMVPQELLRVKEMLKKKLVFAKNKSKARSSNANLLKEVKVVAAPGDLNWKR